MEKTQPSSFRNNSNIHQNPTSQSPDRTKYTFSNPWFESHRKAWETCTKPLVGQPLRVLEIGSFEGASTTWILDNLMDHPDSRLVAIDHFSGGMEHSENDPEEYKLDTLENRFWSNISQSKNKNKLDVMKMNSHDALIQLAASKKTFDFIYIDGSHVAIDTLSDAVLSWSMLAHLGVMIFDDLHWRAYEHEAYNPRVAIVSFLACAAPFCVGTEIDKQMWVQKVPTHIEARFVRRPS